MRRTRQCLFVAAIVAASYSLPASAATITLDSGDVYTFAPASGSALSGFSSFVENGSASADPTQSQVTLTSNLPNQASSIWTSSPYALSEEFYANFTYTVSGDRSAEGMTFTIQNDPAGNAALGASGGGLGFDGITHAASYQINLLDDVGAVLNYVGTGHTGALPYASIGPVDPTSGHPIAVSLAYSNLYFTETLVDTVNGNSHRHVEFLGLDGDLSGTSGYLGFTGATGTLTSTQSISDFSAFITAQQQNITLDSLIVHEGGLLQGTGGRIFTSTLQIDGGVIDLVGTILNFHSFVQTGGRVSLPALYVQFNDYSLSGGEDFFGDFQIRPGGVASITGGTLTTETFRGADNYTWTAGTIVITGTDGMSLNLFIHPGRTDASKTVSINPGMGLIVPHGIYVTNGYTLIVNGGTFSTGNLDVDGTFILADQSPPPGGSAFFLKPAAASVAMSGPPKINSLIVFHDGTGTAAFYTGSVLLNNNHLIVQSSDASDKADKILSLNEAIFAGHNGTSHVWSSTQGITSATVAADPQHLTLGVYDNAALHSLSSPGQPRTDWAGGTGNVDTNSILITTALKGDANLDGIIDIADMVVIANNWNLSGQQNGISTIDMAHGDVNQDGIVDIADMVVVANNWNAISTFNLLPDLSDPALVTALATPAAPVPEPGTAALMILSIPLLSRRRRS